MLSFIAKAIRKTSDADNKNYNSRSNLKVVTGKYRKSMKHASISWEMSLVYEDCDSVAVSL